MSESPIQTKILDVIEQAFTQSKGSPDKLVPEYEVSALYLAPEETKQAATYCIVVGDEAPTAESSLENDMVGATVRIVCWAKDGTDPQRLLHSMKQDAKQSMRLAVQQLRAMKEIVSCKWEETTGNDPTTVANPIMQAVLRYTMTFQERAVMA